MAHVRGHAPRRGRRLRRGEPRQRAHQGRRPHLGVLRRRKVVEVERVRPQPQLARRFDVDPSALLSLNGLSNGNIFYPGRTLKIPQTGSFPGTRALRNHPASYTVASSSESIYSIACLFGDVRPEAIVTANNLSGDNPDLTSGQQLSIP